jgi:hypothetical protein
MTSYTCSNRWFLSIFWPVVIALAYYHANREAIEADIAAEDAEATAWEREQARRRGTDA